MKRMFTLILISNMLALNATGQTADHQTSLPQFMQGGEAGFVVAHIEYALGNDADATSCPKGLTPAPIRDRDATANACTDPVHAGADPQFHTVTGNTTQAWGINLDGRDSEAAAVATNSCRHQDLVGMTGERGVDNQFYRVIGCVHGYQSTGSGNRFEIEMLSGSWGVLITLSDLDSLENDDNVVVGFYANADPIELSASRIPLRHATYARAQDKRYRATTRGRIVNGTLTTDPVDVRFRKVVNAMYMDRPLRHAVARLTFNKDNELEGYLAGYSPVDAMYELEFAFRNATKADGSPADSRLIKLSSSGRAENLHYSCNGVYHALQQLADADPELQSGRCTSISTQYRIKAVPAFVVDMDTQSKNEELLR